MKNLITFSLLFFLLSGCSISRHVEPVRAHISIDKVYIQKNTLDHMEGLLPELVAEVQALGFAAQAYQGERPEQARFYIIYQANWSWDMAMYLVYFHANLYDQGKIIGQVDYNAKNGGANMGKFGHTSEKIQPLLEQLFAQVKRSEN